MTMVLVSREYMCNQEAMKGLYREYEEDEQHSPTVICFTQSFDQLCESVDGWEAITPEDYWRRCAEALCMGTSIGYRFQSEVANIHHCRILRSEILNPSYALFVHDFMLPWFKAKGNPIDVWVWEHLFEGSDSVLMSDDKSLAMS